MQYAVSNALVGAATLDEAFTHVLRILCENMNWAWGAVWTVDRASQTLHYACHWSNTSSDDGAFEHATRTLTFGRGVGIPGRVLERGEPAWIQDVVHDPNFPRARHAEVAGFHSALGFPIKVDGDIVHIVEFFSHEIQEPDDELLAVIGTIVNLIEQYIERARAIAELRASESRNRSILETSIDAIVIMDQTGHITEFNPAAEAMFQYSREEAIGQELAELLIPPYLREQHRAGLERYLRTGVATIFGQRLEFSATRAGGQEFPVELTVTPVQTNGPAAFIGFVRDITTRRRAEAQARFLAEAGESLGGSLEYERTLASVARLAVPFFADWCIVDLIDPEGAVHRIAAAHAAPGREDMLNEMVRSYPPIPGHAHPAVEVAMTGQSKLIAEVTDEIWEQIAQDECHLQMLRQLEPRSGLTVPLTSRGNTIGAIEFLRSQPGWIFDDNDVALGEEVARRAAIAVENAHLYQSARDALANREETLALLETVLVTAPVGLAFWDLNLRFVRINQFMAAIHGLPPEQHLGRTISEVLPTAAPQLEPTLRSVLETGTPVLNIEISDEPAASGGQFRHLLASYYPVRKPDGQLFGIGGVVADISERRRAEDRLRFLAEASAIVSQSLDYEQTLRSVARLAVPFLADWCIVYLIQEDGSIRRIAVEYADPKHQQFAVTMQEAFHIDPHADAGVAKVIRTGVSTLHPHVHPDDLTADVQDPGGLLQLTAPLDIQSWICVPLMVHGQSIGAISFMQTADGKPYDDNDLALAEDIGRRAAIAVENARLYRAEQETRHYAEQVADRTIRLQAVTSALSSAVTRDEVAEVIANLGVATFGAQRGLVALLTDDGNMVEIVRAVGYPDDFRETWRQFPVDVSTPPSEVIRSGEPLLLETFEARSQRFPHLIRERTRLGAGAIAAIPMMLGGKAIGAIALGFSADRSFDTGDRSFLLALAQQCAQAFDRARLYEEEQSSRAAAEQAREQSARQAARQRVVAEASRAFAEASLDVHQLVETVTHQVADVIGDHCWMFLNAEDGATVTPAMRYQRGLAEIEHDHDTLVIPLQKMVELFPAHIFSATQPVVVTDTGNNLRSAVSREFAAMLEQFGVHCLMVIPVRIRGELVAILVTTRDRTPAPYTADDQALLEDLADRATLAIEKARLYREAQEAIRSREQFLSIASHELKTPLTSIKASAQLLDRWFSNPDVEPERIRRISGQLRGEIARLETLVADLLDASRIQQDHLDLRLEPIDLVELAHAVVLRFEHAPERLAQHTLIIDATERVEGLWDMLRLDQVLTNLVSNALKYSPEGGEVRISIRRDQDSAVIAVMDQGIGLTPAEQSRLFIPFSRGDAARQHAGGTGLGLYISSEIINRHAGTITVESELGVGSTFTVRLPFTPNGETALGSTT